MKDIMVSVRMPPSLTSKLKDIAKKNDFLDVSEALRSMVRHRWIKAMHPELYELQQLRATIQETLKQKAAGRIRSELIKELNKIKEGVQKGL